MTHARGIHNNNFADLPDVDIVFGTFFNPRRFAPAAGFHDGASYRVGDMLLARGVSEPSARRAGGTRQNRALRPISISSCCSVSPLMVTVQPPEQNRLPELLIRVQ